MASEPYLNGQNGKNVTLGRGQLVEFMGKLFNFLLCLQIRVMNM